MSLTEHPEAPQPQLTPLTTLVQPQPQQPPSAPYFQNDPTYYDDDDSGSDDSDDEDFGSSSVVLDGSMTASVQAPWVVRANACGMEAEQAEKQSKWRKAIRKNKKAAEWFQYAVEDTTHPDTKRDLFRLSQYHHQKATEIRNYLERRQGAKESQAQANQLREGGVDFNSSNPSGGGADSQYYENDLDYSALSPEAAEELNAILGPWRTPGRMPERVEQEESWWKEGFWCAVENLFYDFFPKLPTTIVTSPRETRAYPQNIRLSDDEWVQTATAPTPPPRVSLHAPIPNQFRSASASDNDEDLTSSSFFLMNVSGDGTNRTSPGRKSLLASTDRKLGVSSPSPPPLSANSSLSSLSSSENLKQQPGTVSGQPTVSYTTNEAKPLQLHRSYSNDSTNLQSLSNPELIQEIHSLRQQVHALATENDRLSMAQQEGARLIHENETLKSSVIRFRNEIQKKATQFRLSNPGRFGASMTTLPNPTQGDASVSLASASVMPTRRVGSPDRSLVYRRPPIQSPPPGSVMNTSSKASPPSASPSHSSLEPRVLELEALVSQLSSKLEDVTNRYHQAEQALRRYERLRSKINSVAQQKKRQGVQPSSTDPSSSSCYPSPMSSTTQSQFLAGTTSCSTFLPEQSTSGLPSTLLSSSVSPASIPTMPAETSTTLSGIPGLTSAPTLTAPSVPPSLLLNIDRLTLDNSLLSGGGGDSTVPTSLVSANDPKSSPRTGTGSATSSLLLNSSIPVAIPVHHTFSSSPPSLSPAD